MVIMIECRNIVKKYKTKVAVAGINLIAKKGEIVGLLGPNGAGKTTTFYMISGFIRPTSGQIFLDGQEITKMPIHKRSKIGISYLPQEPSVFSGLTVEQNIYAVLEFVDIKNKKERLEELLSEFNLTSIRKTKAYAVSGGERRRVEVARALATNPKFLLLDEPFSGIDPLMVEQLKKMIFDLKERGLGIIITDHNVRETLDIVNKAYILYDGKVIKEGSKMDIVNDERLAKIYLGETFKL
ncbi:lipopolysaccharide export system ATP-binding protein [Desulfurella multipotens]|uniref:Lipopolysaccharide export system ATP-binding protein n=2 Tax=Desulfurellaceae TaxID=117942 RepID=A0A1G6NXW1_9BACT|nr:MULTISPECIES: LPS export ABC transporter ATP-binding protein [Desulfurella]AHF96586.1 ABC transporter ATP-binding protein [Desulfurella acetivorans A63]SDC72870.1 lipopolysaccharide export system ATP-binding protein [Desulfurella multipotens]